MSNYYSLRRSESTDSLDSYNYKRRCSKYDRVGSTSIDTASDKCCDKCGCSKSGKRDTYKSRSQVSRRAPDDTLQRLQVRANRLTDSRSSFTTRNDNHKSFGRFTRRPVYEPKQRPFKNLPEDDLRRRLENRSDRLSHVRSSSVSSSTTSSRSEGKVELDNNRSIYIGNLHFDAVEEDLRLLFAAFGKITNVVIPLHVSTRKPLGYAFIEFAERSSVEKSFAMDDWLLKERHISVKRRHENVRSGNSESGRASARFFESSRSSDYVGPSRRNYKFADKRGYRPY